MNSKSGHAGIAPVAPVLLEVLLRFRRGPVDVGMSCFQYRWIGDRPGVSKSPMSSGAPNWFRFELKSNCLALALCLLRRS